VKVTPEGLPVLADACGVGAARELSRVSPREKLNAELAVAAVPIRYSEPNLRAGFLDLSEVEGARRRLNALKERIRQLCTSPPNMSDSTAPKAGKVHGR
jgi:hypothetical protein